jgi:hypothetical protein
MPAELDYTKGFAAVMTVGETAWHREGTNVPRGHPAERDGQYEHRPEYGPEVTRHRTTPV